MQKTEANAQTQVKFKLDTFYIVSKKDYNQNMGSEQGYRTLDEAETALKHLEADNGGLQILLQRSRFS